MTPEELQADLIAAYPTYETQIRSEVDWDFVHYPDLLHKWLVNLGAIVDEEAHDLTHGIITHGQVKLPPAFAARWNYDFSINRIDHIYSIDVDPRRLVDSRIWSGPIYYVNGTTGDNGNPGTQASPVRDVYQAFTLGNLTGAPYRVSVAEGWHPSDNTFTRNGQDVPTQPVAIIGEGAGATCFTGPDPSSLTWLAEQGNAYNLNTSISSLGMVFFTTPDLFTARSAFGEPTTVGTLASVRTGSRKYYDGVGVPYVNLGGIAPGDDVLLVRNIDNGQFLNHAHDLYLENLTLYGGLTGSFHVDGNGNSFNVVAVDCNFGYTSHSTRANTPDAVPILNVNGLVALFQCTAEGSLKDGFNFHQNGSATMSVLLVDCEAKGNGYTTEGDFSASNSLTAHDDVTLIDINGKYGGFDAIEDSVELASEVHMIEDTYCCFFGTQSRKESSEEPTAWAYRISNNAHAWFFGGSGHTSGASDNHAIQANGGRVFTRNFNAINAASNNDAFSAGGTIEEF